MPGQRGQRYLQHDFAGALWPAFAALGVLKPSQVTADVDEDARHLRPDRVESPSVTLAGGDDAVGKGGWIARGAPPPAVTWRRVRPVGGDAGVHGAVLEIGAQALTGFILIISKHARAITILATAQPRERAFRVVDENGAAAGLWTQTPRLMLRREAILAPRILPRKPCPARCAEAKTVAARLQNIVGG